MGLVHHIICQLNVILYCSGLTKALIKLLAAVVCNLTNIPANY